MGEANRWADGFVINTITVTNDGTAAVSGWKVTLDFSADTAFDSGWGGNFDVSGNGSRVTLSNLEWNGNLQPGASASFGLQGTHSGNYVEPMCSVN
ncbi:cellulose-binding domain-containing protein [Microbulbifer hydrolyticus]|uniref:cellulose-binding domain-containing protein n=1 Tax=Microbulbifer hydrolyticus TaxID=48074 RepID=UPI0021A7A2C8|nr:cellulose-binding domain-containing protein [Microbulbifer hydrolyticus]